MITFKQYAEAKNGKQTEKFGDYEVEYYLKKDGKLSHFRLRKGSMEIMASNEGGNAIEMWELKTTGRSKEEIYKILYAATQFAKEHGFDLTYKKEDMEMMYKDDNDEWIELIRLLDDFKRNPAIQMTRGGFTISEKGQDAENPHNLNTHKSHILLSKPTRYMTTYHATMKSPEELNVSKIADFGEGGLHVGTYNAAKNRVTGQFGIGRFAGGNLKRPRLFEIIVDVSKIYRMENPMSEGELNAFKQHSGPEKQALIKQGYTGIAYKNELEDKGRTSLLIWSPSAIVRTGESFDI